MLRLDELTGALWCTGLDPVNEEGEKALTVVVNPNIVAVANFIFTSLFVMI